MRRRDPGVVQVELLEGDAALEVDGVDAHEGDPRETARARRLRWVGLAVVAILLGTIVAATVIDSRREAARRAALAELGWVLPSLEGPLEEVWRAPGGWVMALTDDVIVTQGMEGDIRALDAVTGAVLWERGGAGGYESCALVYDYRTLDAGRYPTADTLVCVSSDLYGVGGLPVPGATVEMVAVEIATGARIAALDVQGGLLTHDTVDADVLATFVDATAAIGVIRWNPLSGEVWRYRSAPGLFPDGSPWGSPDWAYELREDVLRLTSDLAIDLATGREAPVAAPARDDLIRGYAQDLPGGARVEWRWEVNDSGWAADGRVLNADGSLRFEVDGGPWTPGATDGSPPDAVLAVRAAGEAVALDPDSGSELWSVPDMSDTWAAIQLEGILVAVGPTTVTALYKRDGTMLWQVDTGWATNNVPPTDGDVVLVQVADRGETVLVAVDLRTGTEAWRMPGPGWGYWDLLHVGGRFLLIGDSQVVGLR